MEFLFGTIGMRSGKLQFKKFLLFLFFSGGSVVKNMLTEAGDAGSVPGSGRSPGKGNGNPLQYSCLGNPTDRGAWQATVHEGHKRVRHDLATKQQFRQ